MRLGIWVVSSVVWDKSREVQIDVTESQDTPLTYPSTIHKPCITVLAYNFCMLQVQPNTPPIIT